MICDTTRKLAFTPDWSEANPYQKLLYKEMEASGISCCGLQGSDFTFWWIIKNSNNFRFIHLHWLHGLYHLRSKSLCWTNLIVLALKILVARMTGYTIFWTVHNIVSHDTANYKLELTLRKIVARIVNVVIVHCEHARDHVINSWGINPVKVKAIPHGSYIGYYPNEITRNDARKRLKLSNDGVTFLFFGMLRNYKGVRELIGSYKQVNNINNTTNLIIAGNPHNETMRAEIEEMVDVEGISLHLRYIDDEDVQLYFNASDVVVLPYLNILTSGAAVLALSFGKPVIAPAKGCIPELLDDSLSFLYNNGDGLTNAMLRAMCNRNLNDMGKKALERAEELQWGRIVAEHYLPLVRDLSLKNL